jgi:hypothetical protein
MASPIPAVGTESLRIGRVRLPSNHQTSGEFTSHIVLEALDWTAEATVGQLLSGLHPVLPAWRVLGAEFLLDSGVIREGDELPKLDQLFAVGADLFLDQRPQTFWPAVAKERSQDSFPGAWYQEG